jgi:hypothetical protein
MKKASTGMLEQGIQAPSPAPDLIPAETSTENLHWDWYNEPGHFTVRQPSPKKSPSLNMPMVASLPSLDTTVNFTLPF